MKKIILVTCLISWSLSCSAQSTAPQDLEAYFSAMIVKDIDASDQWYTEVLGFKVVNRAASKERGFKQLNLKRGEVLIELIELEQALSPQDVIPNYHGKTRMIGFFKTGFLVSDFQVWMNHLTSKQVDFHGTVVTDPTSEKRMIIVKDPDGNRIQIFEK